MIDLYKELTKEIFTKTKKQYYYLHQQPLQIPAYHQNAHCKMYDARQHNKYHQNEKLVSLSLYKNHLTIFPIYLASRDLQPTTIKYSDPQLIQKAVNTILHHVQLKHKREHALGI